MAPTSGGGRRGGPPGATVVSARCALRPRRRRARSTRCLPADKTALAEDPAGDFRVGTTVEINAEAELPEGVFAYESAAGTRYRFNAGGTSRRGFKTPEAALIETGRF